MLAGVRLESLTFDELLDVTEAVIFEPGVHQGMSPDTLLDQFDQRLREAFPDEETWGEGPEMERQAMLVETMFPPVFTPEQLASAEAEGNPVPIIERVSEVRSDEPARDVGQFDDEEPPGIYDD